MSTPALPARKLDVIVLIIMLNLAIYLAQLFVHRGRPLTPAELIAWGGNVAPLTMAGEPQRLFTSMFLHAGFLHLTLNLYTLFALGPIVERMFGSLRFSLIYVLSGMFGGLLSAAWNAHHTTTRMTVVMGELVTTEQLQLQLVVSTGASGALMGIAGACLAHHLAAARQEAGGDTASVRGPMIQTIGIALVMGTLTPGVDNACHAGGLLAGFLLGGVLALTGTGQNWRRAVVPATTASVSLVMMAAILQGEPTAGLLVLKAQLVAEPPSTAAMVATGRQAVASNRNRAPTSLLQR